MRPAVLHILAPSPVGGLEAVVESLARSQAQRGTEVHVGAVMEPEARPHPFVDRLKGSGLPVESLTVPHRAYLTEARAIRHLVGQFDPDVVHTHGYRADVVAGTVARWEGRPVVSTVHGFTGGGRKNQLYEWLQQRSLARFDAVVSVSRPMGRELRAAGIPAERIHVIPNAWRSSSELMSRADARRLLDLPEDAWVAGWVGRLSREKGADVLLRSLARIEGSTSPAPTIAPGSNRGAPGRGGPSGSGAAADPIIASVIGDGAQESTVRQLVEELDIAERVHLHGRMPGAAELYRAFDVFALSSRTEGTPVCLFEAIEAGVPVVATRVGGVPDVVTDDQHALLVPPEEPSALARALWEVRRDPAAAKDRARRARQRLRDDFSVEPWLDRYDSVYRGVLGREESVAR